MVGRRPGDLSSNFAAGDEARTRNFLSAEVCLGRRKKTENSQALPNHFQEVSFDASTTFNLDPLASDDSDDCGTNFQLS
jgi:hypothetical protein